MAYRYLGDYERRVKKLSQLELEEPSVDADGRRTYGSDAEECAARLWEIPEEIDCVAWTDSFRRWAREVSKRARAAAAAIRDAHGLNSNVQ